MRYEASLPTTVLAAFLRDLIGMMRTKAYGLYLAAKCTAMPEPIDLPDRIMSEGATWFLRIRKSHMASPS